MANYIHSTASQDMTYRIYAEGRSQNQATPIKDIVIKGRANVVDPKTLVTPNGAVTEISDADLELLKKNKHFQRHVTHGFMKVITNQSEFNKEGLNPRDGSAQLQDDEYATDKDPRVPGSGSCQATCGDSDRIKGTRGNRFVGEF